MNNISKPVTLQYIVGNKLVESIPCANIVLANWKINQLNKTTHKLGTFKIV